MLVDKSQISLRFSETKLAKRNRELAVLYDIGSDLTSSLGLTDILDRSIMKVQAYFKVDAVRMYLMDESERNLELLAHTGIAEDYLKGLQRVSLNEGFSGKSARTKRFIAQRVSDLKDQARRMLLQRQGFKVVICVPLIVKNRVFGVMNLASKRMISLNQKKVDLLLAVGNEIAIAVNVATLHDEIRRKAAEIEKRKDELELFAYTIAHDLKNPAVGISGFVNLLVEKYQDKIDDKGRVYCDQITRAARQIEALITDINDYVKSKKVTLHFEELDIKRVIGEIRDELTPVLENRHIRWTEPDTIPQIVADESAILRVFRNLIHNALKHGGNRLSKLSIGYGADDDFHIFSFKDDGIGIRKEDSETIFQMFRRLPRSRQTEGSGLGLTIVKDVMEAHQGKVWVQSEPNKGATFFVSISKKLETKRVQKYGEKTAT
jgi:signal transduction histidine kinase